MLALCTLKLTEALHMYRANLQWGITPDAARLVELIQQMTHCHQGPPCIAIVQSDTASPSRAQLEYLFPLTAAPHIHRALQVGNSP
jgi:hypothetical protein